MKNAKSPLQKLFNKQQPKVKYSERKCALLKTYSDDNIIAIAKLIQKWLDEDAEQNKKHY